MRAVATDAGAFLASHRGRLRSPMPTTPIEFDRFLRNGVPASLVSTVSKFLDLTQGQTARLLHISPSTLRRRLKGKQRLKDAEANAMYRVLGTLGVATRVLKGDGNSRSWLKRGQPGLEGKIPVELLGTDAGADAIILLLEQIRHGVIP